MLFGALAEDLERVWASGEDLSSVFTLPSFANFMASPDLTPASRTLEMSTLEERDLDSISLTSGKVRILASSKGWSASLVQRDTPTSYINAAPFLTILVPLEDTTVDISTFHIEPDYLKRDSLPTGCEVIPLASRSHDRHRPFHNSAFENAYSLEKLSGSGTILRFTGPPQTPFIHYFDKETRRYRHTAMSTQDYTSRYFYAEALKNILYNIDLDGLEVREAEALSDFMQSRIETHTDMPNESWSLLQALFVLEEDRAITLLGALSRKDGPLRTISTRTLQALEKPLLYG